MKLDVNTKGRLTQDEIDLAVELYDKGRGMGLIQIAEKFGRNPETFRHQFKKLGVLVSKKPKKELAL